MARKVHRRAALALALSSPLALGGCLGYDGDFARGYQVDPDAVSQVKIGTTTKPEALSALGTPSTTSTVGGDAWYYIGQKMQHTLSFMPVKMTDQHVLAVYFDKNGKVTRIANYGIKDGKVFDFVSRTTPTGGSEPDFLKNIMGGLFRFS
ncbi:MAG TPA: outer membrane protein assembly factor BamE [Roseiarcus sp.]|jgi:outer membrane protein assembly factor BamE (lipoprotein component of BamABCDE complex)|nr:outer membrane protein assembly factor BamE [Roseiarcus sp.]